MAAFLQNAARTVWFFNKSDMKTIVFPVGVFAASLARELSIPRFITSVAWIYFALLQFTVSNQSFGDSPAEDAKNKPDRPIPAGLISFQSARLLRWAMVPATLAVSYILDCLPAGAGIAALTAFYNEGRGSDHWFLKNGSCALFYYLFEHGATIVAGGSATLSSEQYAAITLSALIVFTTIHAQDFRDAEGDALMGRSTFPLAYPEFSRITMPATLLGWSFVLWYISNIHIGVRLGLIGLASVTSTRFVLQRDAKSDRTSYLYYNIWLCLAHSALSNVQLNELIAA